MRLSEQLADAVERVGIYVGQLVVVLTRDGEKVGEGTVEGVDVERGLVRIRDLSSGTDIQFDVDTSLYDLWIQRSTAPIATGGAPQSVVVV